MHLKLYHSKLNNNFSTLCSYFHYRQKKKNHSKNHFIIISRQLEIHVGFVIQIKPEEATHCVLQAGNGHQGYESESITPIQHCKDSCKGNIGVCVRVLKLHTTYSGQILMALSVQYHHLFPYLLPHILLQLYGHFSDKYGHNYLWLQANLPYCPFHTTLNQSLGTSHEKRQSKSQRLKAGKWSNQGIQSHM